MVRTLVGATLMMAAAGSLHGQGTGSVRGVVRDETGRPIANATIGTADGRSRRQASAAGEFRFDSLTSGRQVLTALAAGFQRAEQPVDVREGTVAEISIVLLRVVTELGAVVISETAPPGSVRPAPDLAGTLVLAGVKTEMLQTSGMDANMSEKVARQIFARIPGLFVYDMDGTGNQVNVSTRGLDPHRSWEMNVRQDGVLVNSDIYGYPAAHYSPPMEAMERLDLIRGTAALQYGAQFGGLVNYITKSSDTTRSISFESINSAGSFGLLSTFNSVGGRSGLLTWHAYASGRRSDGYRASSQSEASAQFGSVRMQLSPGVSLRAQAGRSVYRYQIPGPLTDAMFEADPRQATRTRNWFSPDIVVPSVTADWVISDRTRLLAQASMVTGDRSSVQVVGFATVADAPDGTGQYGARQVDIDNFDSKMAELRLTHSYALGGMDATVATGLALTDNALRRRQQGRGTRGSGYDLTLESGTFGRDLLFATTNIALYAENMMRVTPRWTIIPGARIERGTTDMTGRLSYLDPSEVPHEITHRYPLLGLRSELQVGRGELYAGWSEAYRPMLLKDVLPENAIEQVDPNLRDASGWTFETGARGVVGTSLRYDFSVFMLRYNNRFGALLRTDAQGASYLFKTNVGSSLTKGLELSMELPLLTVGAATVRAYTATSWFDAKYRKGTVVVSGQNRSIVGNRVETVPEWISRTGLTASGGNTSATILVSYTSSSFADPANTETPSANGAVGRVPSNTLLDVSASHRFAGWLRVRAGVSNALDRSYFTKRPSFYPGPGVWPSDGRSVQLSVSLRR